MAKYVNFALICAIALFVLCFSAADAARQLLDAWDNCHNGWCGSMSNYFPFSVCCRSGWTFATFCFEICASSLC